MNNFNITVIIPVYPPHFHLLNRCIQNLLKSTKLPNQIIIAASEISSDKASELIKNFTNDNVEILIDPCEKCCYSGENRNRGLQLNKSEIVTFVDADDFTHPQKLEIINRVFNLHPKCMMLLHTFSTNINTLSNMHDLDHIPVFKYQGDFQKNDLIKKMKYIHRGHATFNIKVFDAIKYNPNLRHREDNVFTKKVHKLFDESYFLPLPLMIYLESGIAFRNNYYDNPHNIN